MEIVSKKIKINGQWVDLGNISSSGYSILIIPGNLMFLSYDSSSEEVFAAFGGADKMAEMARKMASDNVIVMMKKENERYIITDQYAQYTDTNNYAMSFSVDIRYNVTTFSIRLTDGSLYFSKHISRLLNINGTETFSDGAYVNNMTDGGYNTQMPLSLAMTGLGVNIVNLDIDISGEISKLDANMQTLGWGRTYTAPTSDNIVELLGGNDGIRDLCKKLAPSNNPIVTAPFLAYILPSTLISSTVILSIMDSNMNTMLPLSDGCLVMISMQFYLYMSNAIYSIACGINISNFNLSTQSATYSYSMDEIKTSSGQSTEVLDYLTSTNTTAALSANQGRVLKGQIDGKVSSDEITTIKKLTQSAYDALSTKDSKTLYIIVG